MYVILYLICAVADSPALINTRFQLRTSFAHTHSVTTGTGPSHSAMVHAATVEEATYSLQEISG